MAQAPYPSLPVLKTEAYTVNAYTLPTIDRAFLSYKRAEAIALSYGLTISDVLMFTPKFWRLHQDPIAVRDMGAVTHVTIQYNLCAGTIAGHVANRPELVVLCQDLMKWKKYGLYLLTEVGHGIDFANLETTATLLPDGDFVLHSPTPSAYKHMPSTVPAGKPTVACVIARLIVDGEDRGIRAFVVALNDGKQMCDGIVARRLPERGGAHPVNHSVTSFNNVRLPSTALLGDLEMPENMQEHTFTVTWRLAIGALALGCFAVPAMELCAAISTKYSIRRLVGPPGQQRPIMQFRTQQIPILTTTAQAAVLKAFAKQTIGVLRNMDIDFGLRYSLAIITKAVLMKYSLTSARQISERCGAQGLFEHNQISVISGGLLGAAIAEGDVLTISILLATELSKGTYTLPPAQDPSSLLAKYEAGMLKDWQALMATIPGGDMTGDPELVNRNVLPRCLPLVESLGYRMAYEAALAEKLPSYIIDLFVANVVKGEPTWFIENLKMTRNEIYEMEAKALDAMLPHQIEWIDSLKLDPYITAPMISEDRWQEFLGTLPHYSGTGKVEWGGEFNEGKVQGKL
ncbi:hypothetical protein ABKN59_005494 [Abortiporus biennis]